MAPSPSLWTRTTKNKSNRLESIRTSTPNILSLCLNITANVVTTTTKNTNAAATTKGTSITKDIITIANAVMTTIAMKTINISKPSPNMKCDSAMRK